ncbi:MAG: protein-L-isoaspartate O-methyltransferase [Candidatus Bathyarchaeia archaeon]|nr:protein-L-isoaspartate O-methyltransferase [Candidatus Bathyarchaeota archaeon]
MDKYEELRRKAVELLVKEGILRSPSVIRAMNIVPREEFLPEDVRSEAYIDAPLPIGYGQTTSALHMTAMFCEYAELAVGDKILEVGGGCGYMSCVYAEVVAPSDQPRESWGHVWSAEIIDELARFAMENVKRCGYADRVDIICRDASLGLEDYAPYDAIIVTSAAPSIPKELISQLKPGGCILIPVGDIRFYQKLVRVRKHLDGKITKEDLGGVAFVPMRGKAGWK